MRTCIVNPLVSLIFLSLSLEGYGQYNFLRKDNVPVEQNGQPAAFPWAGGLNNAQFSEIDLNGNSTMDLFVYAPAGKFLESGNRILPFINKGTTGQVDYEYAPKYAQKFPKLDNWVLLRDYDCDGRMDIFTSVTGGVAVYRNTFDETGELSFEKTYDILEFENSSGTMVNLNVNSTDIPAIVDVDGDGDLDILSFDFTSANYVRFYKNLSQELLGNCDTLTFEIATPCWGFFKESSSTDAVTLDDTCADYGSGKQQHPGSTLMTFDVNNNGLQDLLLGDIDASDMTFLLNDGTPEEAYMVYQDPDYPAYDAPVNLTMFPAGFFLDVDNDGLRDLIVAPNSINAARDYNNVWWYKNTGGPDTVHLTYQSNDFIQGDMIECGRYSHPRFFDHNGDGLSDIVVGNFAYFDGSDYISKLTLYENTGTASDPAFELITRDYQGLSSLNLLGLAPTFGDLNGDSVPDMLMGEEEGHIHYFENSAAPGDPASFSLTAPYFENIDIGNYSVPQLVDVNRNGKLDLLVGKQDGRISYYENTGTTDSAVFTYVTDTFGGVDVRTDGWFYGYSVPFLTELDTPGKHYLLAGSHSGYIHVYDQIDGNLDGKFRYLGTAGFAYEGARSSLAVGQLSNDDPLEMILGNFRGGVTLHYQTDSIPSAVSQEPVAQATGLAFTAYPNPAARRLTIELLRQPAAGREVQLCLHDMTGQQVRRATMPTGHHTLTLPVQELPQGVYLIRLHDGNVAASGKVIIGR